MSTIKYLFLSLVLCLMSCTEKKSAQDRELSHIPKSQFTYRGVVEKSIHLKFEKKIGPTTQITALVSTPYDYPNELQYKWKLGDGIQVIEGSAEGVLPSLQKDNIQKISVFITGFDSNQAKHIGFEIIGKNPNKRIYADGVVSSQIDQSFEKIVQAVEQLKAKEK